MSDFSNLRRSRSPLWHWLYHPLVIVSIVLHGLLLVVPVPSALDPEAEVSEVEELPEPEAEIVPVDILNLAPPPVTPPPPAAKPTQPPSTPARAPAPPAAEKLAQLQESLTDEERQDLQSDTDTDESGADEQDFNQSLEEDSSATFDYEAQGQFFGSFDQVDYGNFDQTDKWDSLYSPLIENYLTPEQQSLFFDSNRQPVADVSVFKYITRNVDLVAKEDLRQTAAAAGLGFEQAQYELYGGQRFYTLSNADGTPAAYVSLVDLRGGTAVLVWQTDPRQS
ncbi:hypothetical protein [Sphaerothrix gracilis]|uniref:hypothetical protein n=1 Tax=Sphaerothrix gracilis TaxID=3151835 RepID=UPI0031FD07A9